MATKDTDISTYRRCIIKSFKHNGSLHRMWLENWRVPNQLLHPKHAAESIEVLLNHHTLVREADGQEWISRVPAVSFFLPEEWFNVVALLENDGRVRYYCNIASPPFKYNNILTYIDYDLDVTMLPDGSIHELDRDEFIRHQADYRYGADVLCRVEDGLQRVMDRMSRRAAPFEDTLVRQYYEQWKKSVALEES